MKKILAIILSVVFAVSLCISVSATIAEDDNVTYWYGWKMDGKEIVQGTVTTDADGIVDEMTTKNWEIKAQDKQEKITDTYWSPATVWTKDVTKDFDLVWEVKGGKVEVGFLHCVGATEIYDETLAVVKRDGSDLGQYIKMKYSVDGKVWLDCENVTFTADPENRVTALVSGMTGKDAPKPYNGNGTDAYSEDYFIATTELPDTARYVKFIYVARERENSWDPCVRDARFTAAEVEDSSTPDSSDSSDSSTPETHDTGDTAAVFALIAAIALMGTVVLVKKAESDSI